MISHKSTKHWPTVSAVAGLLLLAAACSTGPDSPGVASLGGATTSSAAAGGPSGDNAYQAALQFSGCMREHGLSTFPDPQRTGSGGTQLKIGEGSGLDPNSPTFQAAQKACQKYMTPGGTPPGGTPLDVTKVAPWAACMRKHGLSNFPDPVPTDGALKLNLVGTGIDPSSTTFENARKACDSLKPGGGLMMQAGGPNTGGGS
jgi:hypothetical protein